MIYTRNGTSSFNPELLVLSRSGDIHPNPGPNTTQTDHVIKSKNNHDYNIGNKTHPNLCNDLPSGFRLTQWNLCSLAPRINNTKLDELKLILNPPGKETHIIGVTESWLDDIQLTILVLRLTVIRMKELIDPQKHYRLINTMQEV